MKYYYTQQTLLYKPNIQLLIQTSTSYSETFYALRTKKIKIFFQKRISIATKELNPSHKTSLLCLKECLLNRM